MMSVWSTDSARIASCAPSGRSLHALVCFRARSTHPLNSWTSHTHWQNSRGSTQSWRWPPQPFTSLRSCITFQLANNITPTSSSPRCKLLPLLCMNLMWVCFHSASQELLGKESDLLLCIGPELSRGHTAACISKKKVAQIANFLADTHVAQVQFISCPTPSGVAAAAWLVATFLYFHIFVLVHVRSLRSLARFSGSSCTLAPSGLSGSSSGQLRTACGISTERSAAGMVTTVLSRNWRSLALVTCERAVKFESSHSVVDPHFLLSLVTPYPYHLRLPKRRRPERFLVLSTISSLCSLRCGLMSSPCTLSLTSGYDMNTFAIASCKTILNRSTDHLDPGSMAVILLLVPTYRLQILFFLAQHTPRRFCTPSAGTRSTWPICTFPDASARSTTSDTAPFSS